MLKIFKIKSSMNEEKKPAVIIKTLILVRQFQKFGRLHQKASSIPLKLLFTNKSFITSRFSLSFLLPSSLLLLQLLWTTQKMHKFWNMRATILELADTNSGEKIWRQIYESTPKTQRFLSVTKPATAFRGQKKPKWKMPAQRTRSWLFEAPSHGTLLTVNNIQSHSSPMRMVSNLRVIIFRSKQQARP